MLAFMSGSNAIAIVYSGTEWHTLAYGNEMTFSTITEENAVALLQRMHNIKELEVDDLTEVRERHRELVDQNDALDSFLVLVDPEYSRECREIAAQELNDLLQDAGIVNYLLNLLLASPLSSKADTVSALELAASACLRDTASFICDLVELQPAVIKANAARESIIPQLYGSAITVGELRRLFVQGQLVRVLVEDIILGDKYLSNFRNAVKENHGLKSAGFDLDTIYSHLMACCCDLESRLIDEFRVGDVSYRSLKKLQAGCFRFVNGEELFFLGVHGLFGVVCHAGTTIDEACRIWHQRVDSEVQTLIRTQDFERSQEQTVRLDALREFFDIDEIRYSQPIRFLSTGKICQTWPWVVDWADGVSSGLSREQIPAEMVPMKPGQSIEGIMEIDARTGQVIRVIYAKGICDPPEMTVDEVADIFAQVRAFKELRAVSWD